MTTSVQIIDSHTAGEPTRVIVTGGPDLGTGPLSQRRLIFDQQYRSFQTAVLGEPRGSSVLVGALIVPPVDTICTAGVIFFNNVGTLGMCGHGTIGLAVTLAHLRRIDCGTHRFETPVGLVKVQCDASQTVTVDNVASYRYRRSVMVNVPGYGEVHGDVAWGGNWFFLVDTPHEQLVLQNVSHLTNVAWNIRQALVANGITGKAGDEIDHIELSGPPMDPANHSRNFVLCPGREYDRSPCGTGTSAKLACLYADGKLVPGEVWRQESVIGSVFEGRISLVNDLILPSIRGTAFVVAETTLLFHESDPFRAGIV